MSARVKVCGVTTVADALGCADAGVDAVGINFWSGSPRCVSRERGAEIAQALRGKARSVALFVDAGEDEIRSTLAETGVEWVQLSGDEDPALLKLFLPRAYKSVRLGSEADVAKAVEFAGGEVLVDASVPGRKGGTGVLADWDLAAKVARARTTWLAGGLTPANVAEAVRKVQPFGVDVASGVETTPGTKDLALVRAFVAAAKGAISRTTP